MTLGTTIGAERSYETQPGKAAGRVAILIPSLGVYHAHAGAERRSRPDALSVAEQMDLMPDAVRQLHAAVDHAEHYRCGQGLLDRAFAAHHPITGDDRFPLFLHWELDADAMVIDDVTSGYGDATAVECYRRSFVGLKIDRSVFPKTMAGGDFSTEWSVCIRLGSNQPNAEATACWTLSDCRHAGTDCEVFVENSNRNRERWAGHCAKFGPMPYGYVYFGDIAPGFVGCEYLHEDDALPGTIGADGCVNVIAGILEAVPCRWVGRSDIVGPGCCIVGCDPRASNCQPQLHHSHDDH